MNTAIVVLPPSRYSNKIFVSEFKWLSPHRTITWALPVLMELRLADLKCNCVRSFDLSDTRRMPVRIGRK